MDLLDRIAEALRDSRFPRSRFAELLRLSLDTADLGGDSSDTGRRPGGGQRTISAFLTQNRAGAGANEGVFPPHSGGRRTHQRPGTPPAHRVWTSHPPIRRIGRRRRSAFLPIWPCPPLPRSWWSLSDGGCRRTAADALRAGGDGDGIASLLPAMFSPGRAPCRGGNGGGGFESAASLWRRESEEGASLRALFEENSEKTEVFFQPPTGAGAGRGRQPCRFPFVGDRRGAFFGKEMRLSPSRVEAYHLCRYAYFCRYGLRARARVRRIWMLWNSAHWPTMSWNRPSPYMCGRISPGLIGIGRKKGCLCGH